MNRLIRGGIALVIASLALLFMPNLPGLSVWNVLYLFGCGVAYFLVVWLALPRIDGRKLKYTLPLGGFFGLCTSFGAEFFTKDSLDLTALGVADKLLTAICTGLVYTALAVLIFSVFPRGKLSSINGRKMFLLAWGVILVCWLPCYIAYYPGIFSYDIPTQLLGISRGTLTTDHPLLHTLFAWGCFSIGKAIHSYTLGAAIYSTVQMVALGAAFAWVVAELKQPILRFGALAWFALIPIHPLFAVNATKDVLFSACIIVFLLLVKKVAEDPGRLKQPLFWCAFVASVVVMALMRNTGIYVFAVFIPFFVWSVPRFRWQAIVLCLTCLLFFWGSGKVLNTTLGVYNGRITESLSVPLQQIACCAKKEKLTEEELKEVERYIPPEVWKNYNSRLADNVKNDADRSAIKQDFVGLAKLWLRLGIKHPKQYVEAFMGMNVGYWYPEAQYPDPMIWHEYIETKIKNMDEIVVEDRNLWPPMRKFYNNIALGKAEDFPPLDLLMKPGLYCWATLCLFVLALYHRNRKAMLVLAFLLLSWALQLLSPIALLRYAYPFITAVPLSLSCFSKETFQ